MGKMEPDTEPSGWPPGRRRREDSSLGEGDAMKQEAGAGARIARRKFLRRALSGGGMLIGGRRGRPVWAQGGAPAVVTADAARRKVPCVVGRAHARTPGTYAA